MKFLDFLTLLVKWKKQIFINLFLVSIISLIIALILPKWYKSTAVVMPPQEGGSSGGLSSLMSGLPLSTFGINLGGGSEFTYMAILKSKSLALDVINKYNLKEFYEQPNMEETFISYYGDYEVMLTEENMISITFSYTDSLKVAEIVNYIVNRLGEISNTLVLERTERNFRLIEKRYFQNIKEIDSLQIALENFQNKYGVIEFYEQTKAIISAVADLEAQILLKKAELEASIQSYGENSPKISGIKVQLRAFEDQVKKLKFSNKEYLNNPFSSMFIPLDKIPVLGKVYTDIYSNLLLQQKLQEFLLPEYEQTKMQLLKKQSSLQVIDYAIPPDYKSAPKRAFIVLAALIIAFLIQFFFIISFEKIQNLKTINPANYEKINFILNSLRFKNKKN
ncbi:MAG: hypothetical protein H6610_09845 [Ignavibacteriales bacterium]|nr:hypothetical protein [Ignavibacteriales bacterium]